MQRFKSRYILISTIVSVTLSILLTSCNTSILSATDTLRLNDTIAPVITISSPQDNGYYASTVIVEGIVTDKADLSGNPGQVTSLSYIIEGTVINGKVPVREDNTFRFLFSTANMTGTIILTLVAGDWNAKTCTLSISLKPGAFPGFRAAAGNQSVTLSWQPVPFAGSYTIYCKEGTSQPSAADYDFKIDNALSSQLVAELQNGYCYSFVIRSHSTAGADNWSGVVSAIPLSPFTLAPEVTGEYWQIKVEWPAIKAAARFIVMRSQDKQGVYTNISGQVTGPVYTDTKVIPGVHYYYKIAPAQDGSLESAPNSGECSPFTPFLELTGTYNDRLITTGVQIAGQYAYAADSNAKLLVIDISYPHEPKLVAACSTAGYAHALCIAGDFVYLAADAAGLQIIGITDPTQPVWRGTYNTAGNAVDVAVSSGFACIADSEAGLRIVNVSNPLDPQPVGFYSIAGASAEGITLDGTTAYIAYGTAGLKILDISTPSDPQLIGGCTTPPQALKAAVQEGYAYLANGNTGLQIINLADPDFPYSAWSTGGFAADIALRGNLAFIANKITGLILVDISRNDIPVQAATCPGTENACAVTIREHYAYLTCYEAGIRIFDIAGPGQSAPAAKYNAYDDAFSVAVQGDYAFLAANSAGLEIVDIADKNRPGFKSQVNLPGVVRNLAVCGDYAFLTGIDTGLQIVCFRDPALPYLAGACDLPGKTSGLKIRGDYAYLAYFIPAGINPNSRSGLQIVNIAHPGNPLPVGSWLEAGGSAAGVTLAGSYAFLLDPGMGITVLDISNQSDPRKLHTISTGGTALQMAVKGSMAFAANGIAGLWVADIADPRQPGLRSLYNTGACSQDIRLANDYAFVANGTGGLLMLNIRDPGQPFKTGACAAGAPETVNAAISGGYGFLARAAGGLEIIDLWAYDH